jgi:hypothetical protein
MGYTKILKTKLRGQDGDGVSENNNVGKAIEPSQRRESERKMKPVKDPNLVEIPKPKGN